MEAYRAIVIVTCVVVYFLLCVVIGLWALRRTRDARDFFMAGRNLGVLVTSVAVFSSVMSGFGFVGGPGLVYQMGVSSFWIVVTVTMGNVLCVLLLGSKLREMAVTQDSVSLPDLIQSHYRSPSVGLLSAVAILLGVLGYLATQIAAMSQVLQSLLLPTFGDRWITLEGCALFSTALLVFYCVTGGIIASVYTDVFQGAVMMVAAVLVFVAAAQAVDGGFAAMSMTIAEDDFAAIGPWGTLGMFGCLSWYFLFALGVSGQPHVITKLMMTRRAGDVRFILPVSIAGYSVTALLWIGLGLAMRTLVLQERIAPLEEADHAAPVFLQQYTHPLLAGIVFAGLFAAIMSTADAFLNIGVAALVHDIPKAILGRPIARELLWARIATALLATFAALVALFSKTLVALLGVFGWGTFAAALVPVVALGFNWPGATAGAAGLAIVTSLVLNFGIAFLDVQLPLGVSSGFFALMVSLTVFVTASVIREAVSKRQGLSE